MGGLNIRGVRRLSTKTDSVAKKLEIASILKNGSNNLLKVGKNGSIMKSRPNRQVSKVSFAPSEREYEPFSMFT